MAVEECVILYNCVVATIDESDHCYPDGMVVMRGGLIEYAGARQNPLPEGMAVDMGGKIIMPGLINTHAHSPASLFRGFADDLFLMDWLQNYMWPVEKNLTAEDVYNGARLSYSEYLRNGMTTNVDMWYFADSVAQAAMDIGLRAVVAAGVFSWATPESKDSLRDADDFVSKYRDKCDSTLIYPCYGPHDAYSNTAETLRDVARLSAKRDTMIHAHISETRENNEELLAKAGVTPTRFFEQAGVFQRRVLGAHCIWLTDEDIKIFCENNAYVSYNPVSNLKLCDGILPVRRLMEGGVGIALGTDGAQSNNSLDLLADQKTGVLIQKMAQNDPSFFPARQAVRMLTIDAAASIGMEKQLGSLEAGKYADIISLDIEDLNLVPFMDDLPGQLYSHITYSATGANVSDVFVGGKRLLADKLPVYSDRREIADMALHTSRKLFHLWKGV